jgi:MFS family permease
MVMAPIGGRISDRIGVRVPASIGLSIISLTIFSFSFHIDHQ